MPVGDEEILPAVVVDIHEAGPPGQVGPTGKSHLRQMADIPEIPAAQVAVEGVVVVRKVSDEDVQQTIVVVVPEIDSHAALGDAVVGIAGSRLSRPTSAKVPSPWFWNMKLAI